MPAAKAAWIALAAWMGFVGGVAWSQRATFAPVPEAQRLLVQSQWAAWYAQQPQHQGQPLLAWSEPSACPCSNLRAAADLLHRASAADIAVVPAPVGQSGMALFDGEGRLRFAGAADALDFCGTADSFEHWLAESDSPAAVMVAACPCDSTLSL